MNKNKTTFFSAGISSILLVFVLLCLIIFAVLSLASANADYKLSQKSAQRTQKYYSAESSAAETLRNIDGLLSEQYNKARDKGDYEKKVLAALDQRKDCRVKKTENGIRIYFEEPIDEGETLNAQLAVKYPGQDGGTLYRIEKWESGHSEDWEPDTRLPVLQQAD